MATKVADLFLYRWRYRIGYLIIAVILIGLIYVSGWLVPGGLSSSEMQSVVRSSALSIQHLNTTSIISLPYLILQRASLHYLGVSNVSIKLPSLILAVLSVIGIVMLLQLWFRRHVAILATIITITTGEFLLIAQSGNPAIVYILWVVWLLLAATKIVRQGRISVLWGLILSISIGLSLYTPLSIYIVVAIFSAAILHPHLRYILRRLSKIKLLLGFLIVLALLVPLGHEIYLQPSVSLKLLGIPSSWPNLSANALIILREYFDFIHPKSGSIIMTPIYGLGSIALIIIGVYRLFTTKYTAKSYIITAWFILLIIILLITPGTTSAITATFVPLLLLIAVGLDQLIHWWYHLFPRNPYARLVGLIPLAIFITGMVFSGVDRYVDGYLYSPQVAVTFSSDLSLLNTQLSQNPGNITLVTSTAEQSFYEVVAVHRPGLTVTTTVPHSLSQPVVITEQASHEKMNTTPYRIITNAISHSSNRFYLYKNTTK